MLGIVTAFLPILLQILGYFIGNYFKGKNAEVFFLQMVNQIELSGVKSVRLNADYRRQLDYLKENDLWAPTIPKESSSIVQPPKKTKTIPPQT